MLRQQLRSRKHFSAEPNADRYPSAPAPRDGPSSAFLADIAAGWHAADDEPAAAVQITSATLRAMPGADAVGILRLASSDLLTSQAPTDGIAADLDELQSAQDEGPSREAISTGRPVLIDALAAQTRWPGFTGHATERGVLALACVPLCTATETLGTLNLYARTPGAFRGDATPAAVIAVHAALALHALAQREQLQRAVVIGQAKGILMARHHCTAAQAFDRLVAASHAANLKLVDVADWLITEQQHRPRAGLWLTGGV